ncbi:DUF707 domain-containing protein [Pseudochrobactrum asaccharolyticum]|uniref:DUF707 domain-containing protein n=1 Tax=Pseudochrobactrum asaccharolyticum TaxID=354351 RepID=UPI0040421796
MNSKPKILCVIRIGNNQSCASWIFDSALLDSVTLVVSRYQSLTFSVPDHPSIIHHEFKGGKWEGIFEYFKANPESLKEYDYYFFPDDDIETTAENIQKFFALCEKFNLKLAQPALRTDSYFSHDITVQRRLFTIRHTDFVELMIPFMSQKILQKSLPFFENAKYGWGLDYIWSQFADNPDSEVGIVDSTPVGHYRPLAKCNTQTTTAQSAQNLMMQEYKSFEDDYDLKHINFSIKSAQVNGRFQMKSKKIINILNIISIYQYIKPTTYKDLKRIFRISKIETKSKINQQKFNNQKINNKIIDFYRRNSELN